MKQQTESDSACTVNGAKPTKIETEEFPTAPKTKPDDSTTQIKEWLREIRIEKIEEKNNEN